MHWVKYEVENKGALCLRNIAVELPFYKLYNLDVWAFISIVVLLGVFTMIKTITFVSSLVFISYSDKKFKKGYRITYTSDKHAPIYFKLEFICSINQLEIKC